MNKQEAIAVIKEQVSDKGRDPDYGADYSALEAAGFKVSEYEREGGEDEGSHYHVVLKLEKEGEETFVKCDGYYQSYDGTDWSYGDTYEVKPIEKVVKDWKKVK